MINSAYCVRNNGFCKPNHNVYYLPLIDRSEVSNNYYYVSIIDSAYCDRNNSLRAFVAYYLTR